MPWKRNLGILFVIASIVFVFVGIVALLVGLFSSSSYGGLSGALTQSMILLPLSGIFSLVFLPWGTVWMYKNTASYSMRDSFREAHRLLVSRFWFWIGLLLLPIIISLGLSGVASYFEDTPPVYFVTQIVAVVVSIALSFVLTRLTISAARGHMVQLGEGWGSWGGLGKFFLGSIALGLLTFFGTLLFIIPGIYFGLRYGYAPYLIAEKGMGIGASFTESSRLTQNAKMDLLAFSLVGSVFSFLAMIPLYLGFIYVLPLIMLAQAVVYVKLSQPSM